MSKKILVMDYHEDLLSRMQKQRLAIRVNVPQMVSEVNHHVNDRNSLFCILYEHKGSLAGMPLSEQWKNIPLAVYVDGMGDFPELVGRLPLIRGMNIKVYISSLRPESYRELKILASLGIHSCLIMDPEALDWELADDLMHYAIYTQTRHANIDPFNYLARSHKKGAMTDYQYVYFNDPAHFLHMGPNEEIALTHDHLRRGDLLGEGLKSLDGIEENEKYIEYLKQWQEFFIKTRECAFCPGWRICLGKFSEGKSLNDCRSFFTGMMDAVDYVKSRDRESEPVL